MRLEMDPSKVKITVECIGCKKQKVIDYAESQRLSLQGDVPLCDECGMPEIFNSASGKAK